VVDANDAVISSVGMTVLRLDELLPKSHRSGMHRYSGDNLRWACKPLLINELLERGYDQVLYFDNDIRLYDSIDVLIEQLMSHSLALTPHWYLSDPTDKQYWLEASFRIGLYNAGFFGASVTGKSAVQWWAACCEYNVKKSISRGLFDDQRYLDLLPILFDKVHIIKHKGCNVAGWNIQNCPRSLEDGQLRLDGKWPLVFIHFNAFTIRKIRAGNDPLLSDLLAQYFEELRSVNSNFVSTDLIRYSLSDVWNFIRHMWWYVQRWFD